MRKQYRNDVWIYRIVVITLGLSVLSSLIGGIILTVQDHQPPEILIALGSAAVGGLAGLLAPSPVH